MNKVWLLTRFVKWLKANEYVIIMDDGSGKFPGIDGDRLIAKYFEEGNR